MRKRLLLSIIMLCVVFCTTNIVNANTGKVDFIASSLSVKPGDTFTVTLSATCEDGINGIITTYRYDEDKLELVSAKEANNNWKNAGIDNAIDVYCNTIETVTSDDIYVLTFKVKDTITTETTATVSISSIKVDSDADESNFTEDAKTLNISIVPLNINTPDDNNNNNTNTNTPDDDNNNNNNNNTPGNDNNNTNKPSDNSGDNHNTNTPSQNDGENTNSNTPNNNNTNKPSQNNATNKDNTTSNKPIPQTGENNFIWMLVIGSILLVGAGYSLIKIKSKN